MKDGKELCIGSVSGFGELRRPLNFFSASTTYSLSERPFSLLTLATPSSTSTSRASYAPSSHIILGVESHQYRMIASRRSMQFLRDAIRVISFRTTSTGAQNPIVVQNRRQSLSRIEGSKLVVQRIW
jgi:hypothetical protein